MDSTNGGPVRVALYIRVSTGEQAKSGYSISDQKRTLSDHAEREGWQVVEIITDDGYSGATRERPGIGRIMELSESGEIDAVLAIKRDRFFRSRLFRLLMDEDLKDHGVRLIALNDTNNRIGDGVQDDFAEWEREQITERSHNGKRSKAQEGKIIGSPKPAYGFSFVRNEKGKAVGYEVDETEIGVVRRIFYEVASGKGLRPLKDELDLERIPTPGNGKAWSRSWIKEGCVQNDLYKPHTVPELRALGVADDVLGKLDADEVYGVYRFKGLPVPIPDAGIPLEVVLEARRRVENNRSPSRAGDRFGELSGGVLFCSECGRRMQHYTTKPRGITYHYYRCLGTTNGKADTCTMRTYVPATTIEQGVWEAVSRLMDDKEYALKKLEHHFAQRRKELSQFGADGAALSRRVNDLDRRRDGYYELAADGDMPRDRMREKVAETEQELQRVERELERVRNRDTALEKLAQTEAEMRKQILATDNNLEDMTPVKRHELYQDLRLRVEVGEDKKPRIFWFFPISSVPSERNTKYVITTPELLLADSVRTKATSYGRGAP